MSTAATATTPLTMKNQGSAGTGMTLSRDIRLWSVASLGEGRFCGIGWELGDGDPGRLRGWTFAPSTR